MGFKDLFTSKRPEEIKDLSLSLGMHFSREDGISVLPLLMDFKLFKAGHSKKVKNLLWLDQAPKNLKTRIFDYQYTISAGNSHQVHRQTVFFFNSMNLGLPAFRLQPEKLIHKIAAWLGMEDIDFESHEEFSDAYHLKGEDEDLVRHTFSDSVLEYFTFDQGWIVEGLNYFLILYRPHKRLPVSDIKSFYEKAIQVYDLLEKEGFYI